MKTKKYDRVTLDTEIDRDPITYHLIHRFLWRKVFSDISDLLQKTYLFKPTSMKVLEGHARSMKGDYQMAENEISIKDWVNQYDGLYDVLLIIACNSLNLGGIRINGGKVLEPAEKSFLLYPKSEISIPKLGSRFSLSHYLYIEPPSKFRNCQTSLL